MACFTPVNQRVLEITDTTFHPRFFRIPDWAAGLLQHVVIFDEHLPFLAQSNRMVVSDGSVKATMAWAILD